MEANYSKKKIKIKGDIPPESQLLKDKIESYEFFDSCEIQFPQSILEQENENEQNLKSDSLFKKPNIVNDDIGELAWDQISNKRKKLNKQQKKDIRKTGTFSVPSLNFPGQNHVWKIARGLQTGTTNIKKHFYKFLAGSLYLIIIGIPNLLYRNKYFSIKDSLKSIFLGLWYILNCIIGIPCFVKKYNENQVSNILKGFIFRQIMEGFYSEKKENAVEEVEEKEENDPIFEFKRGKRVIRFLSEKDISKEWDSFYTKFKKEWKNNLENIKQSLYEEFDEKEIKNEVDKRIFIQERLDQLKEKYLFQAMKEKFNENEHVYKRLKSLLKCMNILTKLDRDYNEKFRSDINNFIEDLKQRHSIRSLISSWIEKKKEEYISNYQKSYSFNYYVNENLKLFKKCSTQDKDIIKAYLDIMVSREYLDLKKRKEKARIAERVFEWKFPIWRPKHWKIEEEYNKGKYYAIKYRSFKTKNNYPFWRLCNMLLFNFPSLLAYSYYYLYINIIYYKFGLKSMFKIHAFYPNKVVNRNTGELETDEFTKIETYCSRFKGLWENIKTSRNKFEDKPELSLIPKGLGRFFNRIWNYGIKLIFAGLFLGLGQPILTILNFGLTIVLFFGLPVIILVVSIIEYLVFIIFYDKWSDKVRYVPILNCIFWKILIRGILFFLLEILSIGLCLISSIFVAIMGMILNFLHLVWDTLMYVSFIKLFRVPGKEDFLAKKISGPGVSSTIYYQIKLPIAKLFLQMYLENMELNYISTYNKRKLDKNMNDFKTMMNKYLQPIGFSIEENSYLNKRIRRGSKIYKSIDEQIEIRKKVLNITTNVPNSHLIRMSKKDLAKLLIDATKIIKDFYDNRLLPNFDESSKILEDAVGNWTTVAREILTKIFSANILTSLEDIDEQGFRLVNNEEESFFTKFAQSIYDNDYEEAENYIDNSISFFNSFHFDDQINFVNPFDRHLLIQEFLNPSKELVEELKKD